MVIDYMVATTRENSPPPSRYSWLRPTARLFVVPFSDLAINLVGKLVMVLYRLNKRKCKCLWVSAHVGIVRKEWYDKAAKAALNNECVDLNVPLSRREKVCGRICG